MSAITFWRNLDETEQVYIRAKYGLLRGRRVATVKGQKWCYGGICGCPEQTEAACAQEVRWNLKEAIYMRRSGGIMTSIWSKGDPLFLIIRDGDLIGVEYEAYTC